jgi:hypothetical protein
VDLFVLFVGMDGFWAGLTEVSMGLGLGGAGELLRFFAFGSE